MPATVEHDFNAQAFEMKRSINVLIYGGGAVGSILGWRISKQTHARVSVVCRSNYDAITRSGFTFRTRAWGNGHLQPHQVFQSSSLSTATEIFDYVICANKVNNDSCSAIIRDLGRVVGPSTTLVSAQNGMDVEIPLQRAFPHNTILSAICNIGCCQSVPGHVEQKAGLSPSAFLMGIFNHTSLLDATRLKTLVDCDPKFGSIDDVSKQRWKKLLFNSVWNATAALTNLDTQQIFSRPAALHLATSIAHEATNLAVEMGIDLGHDYERTVIELARSSAAITPSTLQDARNSRLMEIDSIWGYLISRADEYMVNVPTLQMVYHLLRQLNSTFAQHVDQDLRRQLARAFETKPLHSFVQPGTLPPDAWLQAADLGHHRLDATAVA